VNKLSEQDIEFIQKGFADIRETKSGLGARLFGVRYQLHNSLNPNGHSILERIEYWKNASAIIKENWLFGVGTGDINDVIQKMYVKRNSPLNEDRRLRAHNSYLTFWMTFGILGLCYFVFMQLAFFRQQWNTSNLLGVLFILISFVTFLFEDTLETQMGITYFSLFCALFSNTKTED
jgi:O-antigen ligase